MNNKIKLLLVAGIASAGLVSTTVGVAAMAHQEGPIDIVRRHNATMPTNTRRIWIVNNDNWWTDNNYWVYAWNGNGNYGSSVTTKVTMVLPEDGQPNGFYHGLGYADITLAGATSSLNVRIVNEWGDWGQTVTLSLPAYGTEADVVWMNSGGTWDSGENRNDRNASYGATQMYTTAQMSILLGIYNTCDPSNTFGYNAYPQLNYDFFINTNDEIKKSEETLADYDYEEYVEAGKDYSKINKDKTSKIVDKIAGLQYWYELNN